MPKQKLTLKAKKKGKVAAQGPATENEYLEAGVDAQEAGEKWRAGDAKKSTRFFLKALEIYHEGLRKFPASFEVAFNIGQLQYELTQHPRLLAEMPSSTPILHLLQEALESMRYAVKLQQDHADVLFNTAQVLSSIAEEIGGDPTSTDLEPLPFLEESLGLFQRCFSIQELEYSRSTDQEDSRMDDVEPDLTDGGVLLTSEQPHQPPFTPMDRKVIEEEQWATLVDPVTEETLVDTLVAQLDVMIAMLRLAPNQGKYASWIEGYADGFDTKLQFLLSEMTSKSQTPADSATSSEVTKQTTIKILEFRCALADANYNNQRIDIETYRSILVSSWSSESDIDSTAIFIFARSWLSFNSSVSRQSDKTTLQLRWQALSLVQEQATKLSKRPNVSAVEHLHLLRGNLDLLRFQLGLEGYELATKSAKVLVGNAEKFYRGARKAGEMVGDEQLVSEAMVREALAKGLGGALAKELEKDSVREILKDGIDSIW